MTNKFRYFIGMLLIALPLISKAQEPKTEVDRMPKISGFVQGLYQLNADKNFNVTSNTLRMRRVRLAVDGNLSKNISYKLQGDFINSPILVDAYIKFKVCNEFTIQVGQFKTPFTLESPINPLNLEIFDYGETVKSLSGYDDVSGVGKVGRDIGVMFSGNLFNVKVKEQNFSILNYSIGVFNGNGANVVDNNNFKDFVGRLEFHPWVKALTLSGSFYYGKHYNNIDLTRRRYSFGAQYNDDKLVVRAEFVGGTTGKAIESTNDDLETVFTENLFYSNGYYAVAGYWFHFGSEEHPQKIMPVLRFEHLTKDKALSPDGTNYYTIGINYWPWKSVNFKLDYSFIQGSSNSNRIAAILSYKF
ncbi:MAG: hypothetical protein HUK15_06965 [Bacteroidales bacterium]|nr:hypothetical protein [Bacteroidales bacterium]